jgi:hypothetical protein
MTERFPCRACHRKLETNFYSLSFGEFGRAGAGVDLANHCALTSTCGVARSATKDAVTICTFYF